MDDKQKRKSFTIHDLPSSERPRERLQRLGAESLAAPELLAVILERGGAGESVMSIAQRMLDHFDGIQGIEDASVEQLREVRGIGLSKACQIKAAFELANRCNKSGKEGKNPLIKTPEDAYNVLKGRARGEKKEHFWALLLNTRNRLIRSQEISIGSLDTSIVHPRELFREAIAASASSMIIAHNHPSGNPEASQDDIKLSKRLLEVGEITGIDVIDHIIIGDGRYISLKREGLL